MKNFGFYKILALSVIIGFLFLFLSFLNVLFPNLVFLNTIILFTPRIVGNFFYKGWFEPRKLTFIASFTVLFYSLVTFLILVIIKLNKRK